MIKKAIKYTLFSVWALVLLYNSVYFKNLGEVTADVLSRQFNAKSYATNFWENELMPNLKSATEINYLVTQLKTEKEKTFDSYSNALGIGNIRYFLVKGTGKVESVNENGIDLITGEESSIQKVLIATEYIFGNAVRDASGLININEFSNTMDFNNISTEINEIIRAKVVPPFREQVNIGESVDFVGAIELNREHLNLDVIEVIPVRLEIYRNQSF